jgi:cysteine synthase A
MEIIEATSGNTGISFSALGRAMGHKVTIYMPNWMSAERINLIRSFGAEIRLVSPDEGGFLGSIDLAEQAKKKHPNDVFLPRQFDNCMNCEAHAATTGPEIVKQLIQLGIMPDAFVAGVGTGGTVMGVGQYLKAIHADTKVYPLEPANSPTLSTGHKTGKHRIQGISDEFIPSIVKLNELDEVVQTDDGDAILMAQKLASSLGLGIGISSGANFLGAVMVQNMLGADAVVTTVFADDSKKYLSTDYARQEPVKEGFLTPQIELLRLTVVK